MNASVFPYTTLENKKIIIKKGKKRKEKLELSQKIKKKKLRNKKSENKIIVITSF